MVDFAMLAQSKNYMGKTAPLYWAIAATVFVSLVMLLFYEEVGFLFYILSVFSTTLATFFVTWLGVRRFNRDRLESVECAAMGFFFGCFALILSAVFLALFADPPAVVGPSNIVADTLFYVITGFFFGGFLGPICGALTGFVLARKLQLPDPTPKSG